ncbi:DNA-binding response regulator, OmpR family, contains REC and winged-helix (wHTH) domain [Fontibacillus panacisegetis]|uniref:DNA-binding response regulator, OmpR family, contains REC and winged-helix (WHTH) domain n=1 Tax=Fontibacillus panacisegetis TaxID=670482 RepID=A0A1G7NP23_9BACL|nr:DNA-binding response regulator, OmpR family, contains REC and winged-helix (wHTH) domain [Fontibacillus panacisegetis]
MTLTLWNEHILLVDDEKGILTMVTTILKKEGFHRITTASTGKEALRLVSAEVFNLIVLDVMLPDCTGFELCQQIRSHTSVPILFLTARSGDLDKILGLGIGGDDYITKPFNPLEVVARIQSQLRRQQLYSAETQHKANVMNFGSFVVDKGAAQLIVNDNVIHCPAKEFELLSFLCTHPNQVFTALQLYEQVWGMSLMGDEKTVVIHISRLRKKIEIDSSNPKIIVNVRGIGYKFIPPRVGETHEG